MASKAETLFGMLTAYLDRQGYIRISTGNQLGCTFTAHSDEFDPNTEYEVVAVVDEGEQELVMYLNTGFEAPRERETAVVELITRLNYQETINTFYYDYARCEVWLRSGVRFGDLEVKEVMVVHTLTDVVFNAAWHSSKFSGVINEGMSVKEAMQLSVE